MIAMGKTKKPRPVTPPPVPPPAQQEQQSPQQPPARTYRRDYAQGLNLPPDAAEFLNQIMADDPREIIDQVEAELEAVANEQFEQMRLEILAKEEERKLLWGNKFPRVLGQKPGEEPQKRPPGRPRRVPAGVQPPEGP